MVAPMSHGTELHRSGFRVVTDERRTMMLAKVTPRWLKGL